MSEHELARADREFEGRISIPPSPWYMDTEFCDNCGELLGDFGECPNCGWEGIDWGNEENGDDYEEVYLYQPKRTEAP